MAGEPGLAVGQPGDRSGTACLWERWEGPPVSLGCWRAQLAMRTGSCCQPAVPPWTGPRAPSLGLPLWEVGTVSPAVPALGKFSKFTCTVLPSTFNAFGRKLRANRSHRIPGLQPPQAAGPARNVADHACLSGQPSAPAPGRASRADGGICRLPPARAEVQAGTGGGAREENFCVWPCRRTLSINTTPGGGRWRPDPGGSEQGCPSPSWGQGAKRLT